MRTREFDSIDKPFAVEAPPGKVEVVEFFWYSCPHCHAFEPKLEAWLKQIKAKHSTLDSYFDDAVSKVEDLGDKVVAEVQQAATSTAAAARSAVGENLITRLERALADAKAKIRDATK